MNIDNEFINFLYQHNITYYNLFHNLCIIRKLFNKEGSTIRTYSTDNCFQENYHQFYDDYKEYGGTFIAFDHVEAGKKYWIICHTMLSKEEIIGFFKLKAFT